MCGCNRGSRGVTQELEVDLLSRPSGPQRKPALRIPAIGPRLVSRQDCRRGKKARQKRLKWAATGNVTMMIGNDWRGLID